MEGLKRAVNELLAHPECARNIVAFAGPNMLLNIRLLSARKKMRVLAIAGGDEDEDENGCLPTPTLARVRVRA